jgi:hypothetical protein
LWLFTPLVSFWFLRKQKQVVKPNQKGPKTSRIVLLLLQCT